MFPTYTGKRKRAMRRNRFWLRFRQQVLYLNEIMNWFSACAYFNIYFISRNQCITDPNQQQKPRNRQMAANPTKLRQWNLPVSWLLRMVRLFGIRSVMRLSSCSCRLYLDVRFAAFAAAMVWVSQMLSHLSVHWWDGCKHLYSLGDSVLRNLLCLVELVQNIWLKLCWEKWVERPIAVANGLVECLLLIVNHAIGFKLHVGFVGVGSTSMSTSFPVIFIFDVCVNKSSRLYFP